MSHPEKIIKAVAARVALVLSMALPLAIPVASAAAPAATPPAVKSVRASFSGAATFITVDATSPMAYTVRRPQTDLLVVELHGVDASRLAPSYTFASPLISGVAVKKFRGEGGAQASLEIALRAPARERSHMSDTSLVVELWPETAATKSSAQPVATTAKANDPAPATATAAQQPADRPAGGSAASQEGQRYGQPGFVGEPISLNVVNADIRDILNYITEQYGVNFIIDASVGRIPVTVNVTDVPWNIALDSILKANRLGIEVNGNILRVATTEVLAGEAEVQTRIRAAALENSPLATEYVRLNYARAAGTLSNAAGSTGNFSGGSTGQSFSGGSGGQTDPGILPIIKRRLSKRGAVEYDGRSNTLIITDVRENIDSIRRLITLLDQPEPQVEIETRIVIATRNFSRDLGVQLNASVFGARGSGGAFETSPAQAGLRPGGLPGGLLNTPPATGDLRASAPSTVIGLTTGIFGTAQIGALITAAERNGQAKIVATPRVTALNNRPAQIESGSQIPVVTPQQGGGGGNLGGSTVFTTTFVSVPLRLSVTPQITEAGTVILRVVAENNSVNLTLTNSFGTPGIDTQRMQTEVLVPDGGTTVVGGVLNDREAETQNRTPGLSGIPVIGNLFKRRTTRRDTDELLFFITPRIYRPDYQGRRTEPASSQTGTRFVSIPQPVPLGNPDTNTPTPQDQQQQQQNPQQAPIIVPVPTGMQQVQPQTPAQQPPASSEARP